MTVSLSGSPGVYRTIPASVRRILVMNFFATDACVDQLDAWARDNANHPFDDWPAAVKAASTHVGGQPEPEYLLDIDRDIVALVHHAGLLVQGLFELTGAGANDVGRLQHRVDQDSAALLQAATRVPVLNRFDITVDNLARYWAQTNLPQFHDWEPPLVELLVRDPFLAAQRPRVLRPGSVDGSALKDGGSLLVQTRGTNQSSATAFLDANVGGQTLKGQLIANSGNNILLWCHTVATMSRADTGFRQTPIDPKPIHEYLAFKVAADRQKAPNIRAFDGEKRIIDAVTTLLIEACGNRVGMHEVTGSLRFATSLRMCPSCYLVATQFLVNFPGITVEVSRV